MVDDTSYVGLPSCLSGPSLMPNRRDLLNTVFLESRSWALCSEFLFRALVLSVEIYGEFVRHKDMRIYGGRG